MRFALTLLVLVAFVSGVYTGGGATSVKNTPVMLIEPFYSYTSVAGVQQTLRRDGLAWSIIENSHLPAGDRRPRFDINRVSVAEFHYLGHVGELQFRFFNDRLVSTWFFPKDSSGFARLLEARLKVSLTTQATIPLFTRLWMQKDYKGRVYFGWEDSRLAKEESLWLEKYS